MPRGLALCAFTARAQSNVYSLNIVGYVNAIFQPGNNWFGNPLSNTTASGTDNTLSQLFPIAPDGTTVSLWNAMQNQYTPSATFSGGAWSGDLALEPGTGALLNTPSLFTNTFVGTVLDLNGSGWDGLSLHPPQPFSGPNGLYLLSSQCPVALPVSGGPSTFEAIIGRAPREGEQVTTLDPLTQTYATTTFVGGAWNNGDPSLAIGQAALFNLGPVPEPSVLGLMAVGLGVLGLHRYRARPQV